MHDNMSFATRGSKISMSGSVGGASTHRYRQVDIGKGSRSDFTTLNVKTKGEPKYDFEKFGSMTYDLKVKMDKGNRKFDTFYNPHQSYDKAMVTTGLNHYLGRGSKNHNGLGPKELDVIAHHTNIRSPRLSERTTDRGLLSPSLKQMVCS